MPTDFAFAAAPATVPYFATRLLLHLLLFFPCSASRFMTTVRVCCCTGCSSFCCLPASCSALPLGLLRLLLLDLLLDLLLNLLFYNLLLALLFHFALHSALHLLLCWLLGCWLLCSFATCSSSPCFCLPGRMSSQMLHCRIPLPTCCFVCSSGQELSRHRPLLHCPTGAQHNATCLGVGCSKINARVPKDHLENMVRALVIQCEAMKAKL
jgi:hypothetical protein